ncbi:EAL domain-containing protein [Micromonospora rosaria]|uniref:EAL domain-containing protein n=3 Tax=Micromonospora rosaria TaxID=47874 RepID=UPI0037CC7B76
MEAVDPRNSVPPGRGTPFFGFVAATIGAALLVGAGALVALPDLLSGLPAAFWVMAGLAVLCDVRPFESPGRRPASPVFPSTCFTFAILLGWGLGPAVAVQVLAVVVAGWRMGHVAWRTTFNAAQYACALAAAYGVLRLGPGGLFDGARPGWVDVLVVAGAAAAWFVVNYGLVGTAVRLRFGDRWWPGYRQGLGFELLTTGSHLLLAPVLAAAAWASAALVPLVLLPLFAVYRMARLSAERAHLGALDPLTGLPNRKALRAEVAEQVHLHAERAARGAPDAHLGLLLIDLDRFKNVNDALGHGVGDRLLVEVSARLAGAVAPGELVARLGGDEFAIVAPGLTGVDEARELAEGLVGTLAEPVSLDGLPLDVGGSIGIAVYPEHGEDFATLMRHADVAMYDAKDRSDTVAVYTPESDHNSAERLSLLADLRRVLEAGPVPAEPAGPSAGDPPGGARGGDGAALAADAAGMRGLDLAAGTASGGPPAGTGSSRPASGSPSTSPVAAAPASSRPATGSPPADPLAAAAGAAAGGAAGPGVGGAAGPGVDGGAGAGGDSGPVAGRSTVGAGRMAGAAGSWRWWGRRLRRQPESAPADELITRIITNADPIRRRAGVAPGRYEQNAAHRDGVRSPVPRRSGRSGSRPTVGARRGGEPGRTVDAGEITMYYQPQIAIATGEVVGVEALLRWRHPRRGMVNPEELIRVAEQTAVMRLLTRRVVDDVLAQLATWSAAGVELRAALNVSVRDLHSGEVADQVADRLARYGIRPDRLQVEITEGALMADPRRVLDTITRLHRAGVGISLDDFGTGYSSLQHLRRLPLSEVKVDRSFVLGMADGGDDAAIVRSMIDLAGALGLRVVAEGVEDERTWRLLHAAGCEVAQGWFHARPMPADELATWLTRYRPLRPSGGGDPGTPGGVAR